MQLPRDARTYFTELGANLKKKNSVHEDWVEYNVKFHLPKIPCFQYYTKQRACY
jgi:hypothetical protein